MGLGAAIVLSTGWETSFEADSKYWITGWGGIIELSTGWETSFEADSKC